VQAALKTHDRMPTREG